MDSIIRSLGAGSGIDTGSLVKNLVEIERAPQQKRLDTREESLKAQISAYGTLKSSLSEFQKAMSSLAKNDTFNARSVAFPDSDVITPNSVQPGAQTGTYKIEVTDVAQAQSLASGAYADKDAALNAAGTLTISFGAWTYDEDVAPGADADTDQDPHSFATNPDRAALNITVEASDSLQDIADKINAADGDVQASVLLVDGNYQLLMTAPSGANNALRVSSDDAIKGDSVGLSVFEFNETEHSQVTETQQAKDARLKVNGLEVTRETNEIEDVIRGFNFSLNKADPGNSLTFTVNADKTGAETAVRDFVEAYNLFYETSKNLTGIKAGEDNSKVKGDLSTDGSAKTMINRLRSAVTAEVTGLSDGFTALSNIGIRTNLDGKLSIDESDFKAAFNTNFEQIERLFSANMATTNDQVTVKAGSYAQRAVPGSYDVIVTTNPEKAAVSGNAQTLDFSSPPLTLGSDYAFKITVDGTKSGDIVLNGSYASIAEVTTDLQAMINGDSALKGANVAVDVSYSGGAFTFTSRSYGSSSEVTIAAADFANAARAAELGLAELTDTGVNAQGTIAGETAFGSGNVLLPPIDSAAYGLNFTVGENAVAAGTVKTTYTKGLAGELDGLIDSFLSRTGSIKNREDSINNSLGDIADDRKELDRKMEKLQLRLTSQFLTMERIVNSFKSTGDQLTGLVDRLPFTAKK
ncbi:MAG: flagellar hook protein [Neptuniibacter caesariensis]|uniref:Flagellar hook-associated protein 2 n=1 Tax=Neptuniibacter caesariensis TaxID=207954 RepID=A0A2G6JMS1_NEPCE|nr:MAG: flagellar hook protein [Neptuniibacter caesariensis]